MDKQDLIQLINELSSGLFSVNVEMIDNQLASLQSYYKDQLPPFLSANQQDHMSKKLEMLPKQREIVYYKDSLFMHYMAFPFDENQLVVLGPYIVQEMTEDLSEQILQENDLPISYAAAFYTYYMETLPICPNTNILFFTKTMVKHLLKAETDPLVHYHHLENMDEKFTEDNEQKDYAASIMPLLEKRYELSNQLFLEVSFGNTAKATQLYFTLKEHLKVIKRIQNPLRNQKNLSFVHNTHLRIAAEKASVHPIYLDSISNHYAIQIESSTSVSELDQLGVEMIEKYCQLVKKYSLKYFSPTIRKTINYIHVHLSDELTLDELAQYSNVSTSYLSRVFNKEVGESIPNYINRIRADKAAEMLQFSKLTVQEIGEYVGFYDLNYFTKVFKKYYQMPPIQYQKEHSYL
ncbi:AraC family transcriptional regulator [Gracilibacillus sp. YIM 98692]|uniref:AraC family transcriptional regulator n=1 Tax=Gracilibacillus sp. YIM 98692 TaxID=2663532 RepID=UPI0013D7FB32|nr:AraC family transcriptional regulator [Gracilibacillus sp. YIM 98692]